MVNFSTTVIIMTSNLGSDYLLQAAASASRPNSPDSNNFGRTDLKVRP